MDKEFEMENIFGRGKENEAYAKYFVGQSWLNPVVTDGMGIFNVTFEAKCRNNWHIHHATSGGGQILLCIAGEGWYCEWGKEARFLNAGDAVVIPPNVKHWHGASCDTPFSHLAIEVSGEDTYTEWCEKVTDEEYYKLTAPRID